MIEPQEMVSAALLTVVGSTCVAGLFSQNFKDNWPQFLGMCGVAFWSFARVSQLLDLNMTRLPMQGMVMHASLCLYAVGTAWKVWAHRSHNGDDGGDTVPMEAPYKLGSHQMRQVAGGKS